MQVSDKGLLMLMRHEATVLEAYPDPVGVWTIGVGHTKSAGPPVPVAGMSLSFEECLELFRKDIKKFEAGVAKAVKVPLKQHEFDALVSFHFNTGAIARASFVRVLNAGNKQDAANGMLAWNKAKGKVLPGLTKRRQEERALFLEGDYGNISRVPVYEKHKGKAKMINTAGILGKARPKRTPGIAEQEQGNPVRRVQEALRALGYPEVGFVDGLMGDRTRAAIAAFQINEGLKPTGDLTDDLLTQIMKARPRKISETRRDLQVKDISDSPGVKIGRFLQIFGTIGGVFGASGGALDALTEDSGRIGETVDNTIATVNRVNGVVNAIFDIGPWLGIILIGFVAVGGGWLFIQHLLQGSREGRHV